MKKYIIAITALFMLFVPMTAQRKAGQTVVDDSIKVNGIGRFFSISDIDDTVFARMKKGGSYPKECKIRRTDLRYLQVLHINFKGETKVGELVCNKAIADDMLAIFQKLYESRYPIARMMLIDEYNADDEASMRDNNTSCFCYRTVSGSTRLSAHSQGMAIDINPLQNPCVRTNKEGRLTSIQPDTKEARQYIMRNSGKAHIITRDDLCYKLFVKHGFTWGGAWRSVKDYQHFEKKI